MKVRTVLLLMLLVPTALFSYGKRQTASVQVSASTQQKVIDRLNNAAYDIYLQNPDSARKIAEKALLLSEKIKYAFGIGRGFMNIGYVYWSQAYYSIALFYLNNALQNLPANKPLYIADCYNILGRTYAELGNTKQAFRNLDSAESYGSGNAGRLAEMYSERSYINMNLKNYAVAVREAEKALILNKGLGDPGDIAIIYARLSDIYNRKAEYVPALVYSDTSYRMAVSNHNNRLRANNYLQYALIYLQLHNFNKAILYARRAAILADSVGLAGTSADAYNALIGSYEQQNDLKHAFEYQKQYNRIRDSLSRFDQSKNAEMIQNYFLLNSKLNDMALVEHDSEEREKLVKTTLISMYELVLLFTFNLAILVFCYFFNHHSALTRDG